MNTGKMALQSALINIALLLGSIALGLAPAEFFARVGEERGKDPNKLLSVLPISRNRSATDIRILGVGESTVVGEPYHSKISPIGLLAGYLNASYPDHTFTHYFHGFGGAVLWNLTQNAEGALTSAPDLIVVIAGHNDFLGRWAPNSECSQGRFLLSSVAERSALARLLFARFDGSRIGQLPVAGARSFFDRPVACPAQFLGAIQSYRDSLEQWAIFAHESHIPLIFVFPAANEGAYPPSRSMYTGRSHQEEFSELYTRGRLFLSLNQDEEASQCFQEAATYDANFAELAYQRGKAYRRLGRNTEAIQNFTTAKDNDGLPLRALAVQRRAMRGVAATYNIPMIDADAVLRAQSPDGILDSRFFHDAHHPSISGYNLIAHSAYKTILDSDALKLGKRQPAVLMSELEILKRYGFTKHDWLKVLESRIKWYEATHFLSFDPSDRYESEVTLLQMLQKLDTESDSKWRTAKMYQLRSLMAKSAEDMANSLLHPQKKIGACNALPAEALKSGLAAAVLKEKDTEALKQGFPWFALAVQTLNQ